MMSYKELARVTAQGIPGLITSSFPLVTRNDYEYIIPNKVNNQPEFNSGALDIAINAASPAIMDTGLQFSQATPGTTTWDSVRQGSAGDKSDKSPAGTVIKSTVCDGEDSPAKHNQTCAGTSWVTVGQCKTNPDDDKVAMRIYCGKEWCPVCNKKGSPSHKRRINRILPKAQQIPSMGYFTIQFMDKDRKRVDLCYSKRGLQQTTNKIVKVLAGKRMGRRGRVGGYFDRGLIRWHWFGDKNIHGNTNKWHPHLNVLVDGAWIDNFNPEHQLWKDLEAELGCQLIIHYGYFEEPGQKYNKVAYITRSTFLNYEWNPYMAAQLSERPVKRDADGKPILKTDKDNNPIPLLDDAGEVIKDENGNIVYEYACEAGFRNQRWWGEWKDDPVWSVDPQMEADMMACNCIEAGHCPTCGGDLVWSKPIHGAYLTIWQAEEIGGAGYYRLPAEHYTGPVIDGSSRESILQAMQWTVVANSIMRVRDKNTVWNETLAYIDDNDFIEYELPGEYMREVQGEIWLN